MKEDQKPESVGQIVSSSKNYQKNRQSISEYVMEYKEIIDASALIDFDEILRKLLKNRIDFDKTKSQRPFSFHICPFDQIKGYFKVNIQWAEFDIDLLIAQVNNLNPFRSEQSLKGKFGQVYFTQFRNVQIAVKSFAYSSSQILWKIFPNILRQLSIFKICSSLMCAPSLNSHFGFDLIIYNDCVQYACQKGEPINQLSVSNQKELNDCLAIMHSLRIIHGDIKPENIVFSLQLKKCVFIDFGFSQIIIQAIGFKTRSQFRGTPQYCINQMVQLLVKSQQDVDLYYNDAFGFRKTAIALSEFRQSQIQLKYQSQFDFKRNDEWIFMSFCYYYLKKDYFNSAHIIQQDKQFLAVNISKILQFILKTISVSFSSIFFYVNFKEYKNHKIYKKIEKKTKNNLFGLLQIRYSQKKVQRLTFIEEDNGNLFSFFSYDKYSSYLKILLEDSSSFQHLTKQIILNMGFQCIRFDTPNTTLKNKYKIALKINSYVINVKSQNSGLTQGQNEQFYLKQIRIFFQYLLKQCLEQPFENWKKQMMIDITYQCLLINLQLSNKMDKLLQLCNKYFCTIEQQMVIILQLYNWIYFLKQQDITINYQTILPLTKKLSSFVQNKQNKFKKNKFTPLHQDVFLVFSLLKGQQTSSSLYQDLKKLIQKTKNPKLRLSFRFIMMTHEIQTHFTKGNVQNIYQILHTINSNIDYLRLSLHTCIFLNTKMMISFSNTSELKSYENNIRKIVGCNLVERNCRFLFDKMDKSLSFTKNLLGLICQNINDCLSWINMQRFIFIVLRLFQQRQLDKCTKSQIIKLSSYLNPFIITQLQLSNGLQILYFLIHLRVYLQYLFFTILEGQNQWPLDQEKYIIASHRYEVNTQAFIQIRSYLLEYYRCKIEGVSDKIIKSMETILDFCNRHCLINLKFQLISQFVNIPYQSQYILIKLYAQCKKDNYFFYYFRPQTSNIAIQTFTNIVQKNEKLAYEFLKELTQFIKLHQFHSYLYEFLKIIEGLLRQQHIKQYFKLQKLKREFNSLLNDNPYSIWLLMLSLNWTKDAKIVQQILKSTAIHFNYINCHFRNCYIQSYYQYYLYLHNPHRKKRFIACRIALKYTLLSAIYKYKMKHIKYFPKIHKLKINRNFRRLKDNLRSINH